MAEGFYIEGRRIRKFADIQRNFDYEITFSNMTNLLGSNGWDAEDVTLRVRTFSLPQRGNEPIESNFGAMKQYFPGKPTFGHTMQVQFEETESQRTQNFLFKWQQLIFDINAGHSTVNRKRGDNNYADGICEIATITAYRYNGEALDNKYYIYNMWLQNVDDVTIDYSQNEAVKFNATFQFDFWTYGTVRPDFSTDGSSTSSVSQNSSISET